jgi:membrane protease YdiL (CAAX protease family)
LALIVLLAVGLVTWQLDTRVRLTLMWLVEIVVLCAAIGRKSLNLNYRPGDVGRGALIGTLPALLILFLGGGLMRSVAGNLYPGSDTAAVFQQAVLIAAPVEELFFRGFVQGRWNAWAGAISYAVLGVLCFLPTTLAFPLVLLLVALVWTGMGFLFTFVCQRYGLAAAVVAHACAATFLLVVPLALRDLGL